MLLILAYDPVTGEDVMCLLDNQCWRCDYVPSKADLLSHLAMQKHTSDRYCQIGIRTLLQVRYSCNYQNAKDGADENTASQIVHHDLTKKSVENQKPTEKRSQYPKLRLRLNSLRNLKVVNLKLVSLASVLKDSKGVRSKLQAMMLTVRSLTSTTWWRRYSRVYTVEEVQGNDVHQLSRWKG